MPKSQEMAFPGFQFSKFFGGNAARPPDVLSYSRLSMTTQKRLASPLGETFDDMIHDPLVCGVNNDRIQWRLLTEPELTYQKAVGIALALESTAKHVHDLGAKNDMADHPPLNIHHIKEHRQSQFQENTGNYECHRCGGKHRANSCRFREVKCFNCQKMGHIAKVCHSKSKTGSANTGSASTGKTNVVSAKDGVSNIHYI